MSLRPWLAAAALVGTLAAWRSAPAPSTVRYRIGITSQQTIDLSAFGQGERNQTTQTIGFVTISTADSAGGTVISMKVDSVQLDSVLQASKAVVDSLRGATTRSFISANGTVTRLARDNSSALLLALGLDALSRRFVPPSAAHRKPGATWTDTVDVSDTLPNGAVATRTVSNFAVSEEVVDGVKATKLLASFSSAVQGSQSGPGGDGSFEGTGTGTSTWYYSSDAVALSGTSKNNQNLSFSGGGAPAPIPIKVQNDVAVTRIK
jgi:hypothetical protein